MAHLSGHSIPVDGVRMNENHNQEAPQGQNDALLIHYWYVLRKRRGIVLAFTAFLMLSVGIATSLATPYFAATAVVEISPKVDTPFEVDRVSEFVSASSSSELRNYYATQYKIMQSRSVASRPVVMHSPVQSRPLPPPSPVQPRPVPTGPM